MSHIISSSELEQRVAHLFSSVGATKPIAQQVAPILVLANLSGHDSHGVGMAPRYVDAILEGNLKLSASTLIKVDNGMLLGLDGDTGFGQILGVQAMSIAFERVKQHGAYIFTLARSHHLGRIGHFAEMAVARGWISIHFVNVLSRPNVAPFGGSDGRYGTNPCCIGIPIGVDEQKREPFVLDFTTSRVAQGKMRVAYNKGERVSPGILIDGDGNPTTDPGVVVVPQPNRRAGALMPFGEYKGFGLALVCELLGGALSGGGTWHKEYDGRRAVLNNMLTIVIDPKKLGSGVVFASETLEFLDWLKKSPTASGSNGVLLAGEPERKARANRDKNGITIDDATWQELVDCGTKIKSAF
ncbi:MAG: malate/lactate/ureidoglycolate dehydrogenase [Limnohabitans sp.]|nr:malate/lactate/ureidoglycolate dehydrogenase [Limnohabitans sp.]